MCTIERTRKHDFLSVFPGACLCGARLHRDNNHRDNNPATPSPDAAAARRGGRFARLPLLAGRSFIPLGLFARLPLAMLTVGALTLVTAVTDSYAVGGAAAGAVGIGSALGAPVLGALADRRGQRPVLLVSAVFNTLAVTALILAAYLVPAGRELAAAVPVLAAAFVAGASCPQVGPLARVRWMALSSGAGADAPKTWTPPCPTRAPPMS